MAFFRRADLKSSNIPSVTAPTGTLPRKAARLAKLVASRRCVLGCSRYSPSAHFRKSLAASSNGLTTRRSWGLRPSITSDRASTSFFSPLGLFCLVAAKPVEPLQVLPSTWKRQCHSPFFFLSAMRIVSFSPLLQPFVDFRFIVANVPAHSVERWTLPV